jgi:hypothetical protein
MDNLPIVLQLNVQQVNTILAVLAKASYETVHELIAIVQKQGTEQVEAHKVANLSEVPTGET